MSTALLLGHHGIRALAVEHHRGTAIHPRAAQISQRTMEIFRTVGVEQIVRKKSDEQFVQDGAIMAVETLARSEEHTSELQSRLHLVCRPLLVKKKNRWRRRTS